VVFRDLWKSKAQSKVLAFSCTLILDRIPTKVYLAKRRLFAIEDSKRCVFCNEDETFVHLFLHCHIISKVWREVMNWMQFNFITPPNLILHINCLSSAMCTKKLRRGAWIICHVVIWIIWKMRNDRIFNNKIREVEQIKAVAWHWSMNRLKIASCLFYK
jgi:hypothetical protein